MDILGPRPFPLKESLNDYLQELRDRQQVENEMKEEEEKAEAEKKERDAAVLDFDPDAEEAADDDADDDERRLPAALLGGACTWPS